MSAATARHAAIDLILATTAALWQREGLRIRVPGVPA